MAKMKSRTLIAAVTFQILACAGFSLQALAASPTQPGKPAATVSNQEVMLEWAASQDDNEVSGYNVYLNGSYLETVFDTSYAGALDTSQDNTFYIVAFDVPLDGQDRAYSERSESTVIGRSANDGESGNPAVPTGPDSTAPTVPDDLMLVRATSNAIAFSWSASSDNVAVLGYNVYRGGDYLDTVFTNRFRDTSPIAGKNNIYTVVAFDAADNFTVQSAPISIFAPDADQTNPVTPDPVEPGPITPAPIDPVPLPPGQADTTPPSIPVDVSLIQVLTRGSVITSVSIAWGASTDDTGVDGYNVYRNGSYLETVQGTTFLDQKTAGLDSIRYSVVAFDRARNFSPLSAELIIPDLIAPPLNPEPPTPPTVDTVKPSIPDGLALQEAKPDSVSITWAESTDNVGVDGYNVYRNGSYLATVKAAAFVDNSPLFDGPLSYSVAAFDAARNFSPISEELIVDRPGVEPPDPVEPQPSADFEFNSNGSPRNGRFQVFSFEVAAGELVEAVVNWKNANADVRVFLRDETGTQVDRDTDGEGSAMVSSGATKSGVWSIAVLVNSRTTAYQVLVDTTDGFVAPEPA